ncbi:MAG: PH domain-containing protein [Bryobacteraceae bacterium]
MHHKAKIDWWIAAAVMIAVVVPAAQEQYWVAPLPLLILLSCCAPQSYQTMPDGLLIRAGLVRKFIPYRSITFIGPGSGPYSLALSLDQVKIQYGLASEVSIAPADPAKFLADIESRAAHLRRRGRNLVPVFA